MKRNFWLLSTGLFVFGTAPTLEAQRNIPRDATVYIEEMEGDLDGYIRAEFVKKEVPLKVVLDIEAAEFVLTGSATHLDCYLEELEWRFNNRDNPQISHDTMKRIVKTGSLTYKELVA